jgi:hypothetical protein
MNVIDGQRKRPINTEELLKRIETERQRRQNNPKPYLLSRILSTSAVILQSSFIIALCIAAYFARSEVSVLKTEVQELRNFRTQISAMDPKLKITVLEGKLADFKKGSDSVSAEIAQIREEIETLKSSMKKPRK